MKNKNSMLGIKSPESKPTPAASAKSSAMSIVTPSRPSTDKTQEVKISELLPKIANRPDVQKMDPMRDLPKIKTQETLKTFNTPKPAEAEEVSAMRSPMSIIPTPSIQQSEKSLSVVESLMQKQNIKKELDENVQRVKEEQMSKKTLMKLQPAFQKIDEVLSYQGQMNKSKMDFNSEHYTVVPSQSLFNLTANQIGNLPSWRQ